MIAVSSVPSVAKNVSILLSLFHAFRAFRG